MTRKEFALLAVSTVATLFVAVGLIRWLAPGLLGGPADLQLVQVDEKVPPFFEGVFRPEHFKTTDFMLKDPRTLNRSRPFHGEIPDPAMGPHDILGFRNRSVPAVADVVTIGDSQTYGVNVLLEDAWPARMAEGLRGASMYSMAVGGWGAVQYADMFVNAAAFRPRVIVVAFYTGNDPVESFNLAYNNPLWHELRPDPRLEAKAPTFTFPPPESDWWTARFAAGAVAFAPRLRLIANQRHPAIDAGYGVMRKAAAAMARLAGGAGQRAVFVVVPTKELVYAPRIEAEGIAASAEYVELVGIERERIADLAGFLGGLPNSTYVDVVAPLQQAARERLDLYPENANGHPSAPGYAVIGRVVAAAVAPLLPAPPDGWIALKNPPREGQDGGATLFLIRDGIAWSFVSRHILEANGWKNVAARPVLARDVAGIPKREVIEVDRRRYGPR